VLNRSNMVGLLYIHDAKCGPQQHAAEALQLMAAFDHQYPMGVFKLKDKGGVQGDLLTTNDSGSSGGSRSGARSEARNGGPDAVAGQLAPAGGADATAGAELLEGCRLLTFQEYLDQQQEQQGAGKQQTQQQQQQQQQQQEQRACAVSALQQTFA
jgi:hypothetical protein